MTDKIHKNTFKFVIYQGRNVISERVFSADCFNPVIRYSVDIRSIIPEIIQRLQRTLSRRNLIYNKIDEKAFVNYNFLKEYQDVCYDFKVRAEKLRKPFYIKKEINGKIVKGTECRFGLYINNNPIVERDFTVDLYNPAIRFSYEIVESTRDLVEYIENYLKETDVKHMWDDYDLIGSYGIYINQIRDLSFKRRKELIENIGDTQFVRKVRAEYRSSEQKERQERQQAQQKQ